MIGPDQDWVDEQRRAAREERRQLHREWHRRHGIPCSGYKHDPYCVKAEAWANEVINLRAGRVPSSRRET